MMDTQLNKAPISFSGHETFSFRYSWLKKGVDAVQSNPNIFISDQAMVILGVGKNMVSSIRHWCLTARLIEEDKNAYNRSKTFIPTYLGKIIFADRGLDPYLEDPATLWIVHWQIATNISCATSWYWVFSHWNSVEFTKDKLVFELKNMAETHSTRMISTNSIARDVDCFVRTYVPSHASKTTILEDTLDCPLVELELISELSDSKTYRFNRGPKRSLPNSIVAYTIIEFWNNHNNRKETLSFEEVTYLPGSPGKIFKLDESSMVIYLENLETLTNGALVYDETAGLKQIYRRKDIDSLAILNEHYTYHKKQKKGKMNEPCK